MTYKADSCAMRTKVIVVVVVVVVVVVAVLAEGTVFRFLM